MRVRRNKKLDYVKVGTTSQLRALQCRRNKKTTPIRSYSLSCPNLATLSKRIAPRTASLPRIRPGLRNMNYLFGKCPSLCTVPIRSYASCAPPCCPPSCLPSCSGGCLPPPCTCQPKCLQYMTGYYYYPYGYWFCGPLHATSPCVPVCGAIPPKCCPPCGACGPCLPCGPCCNPCGSCCPCAGCCAVINPESKSDKTSNEIPKSGVMPSNQISYTFSGEDSNYAIPFMPSNASSNPMQYMSSSSGTNQIPFMSGNSGTNQMPFMSGSSSSNQMPFMSRSARTSPKQYKSDLSQKRTAFTVSGTPKAGMAKFFPFTTVTPSTPAGCKHQKKTPTSSASFSTGHALSGEDCLPSNLRHLCGTDSLPSTLKDYNMSKRSSKAFRAMRRKRHSYDFAPCPPLEKPRKLLSKEQRDRPTVMPNLFNYDDVPQFKSPFPKPYESTRYPTR